MIKYEGENPINVPRFSEENGFYTTRQRSALMSKIRSKNTSPEMLMRKSLWGLGMRYRIHNKLLPGNPDILMKKYKLVIFIDGEFWHGYEWEKKREKIKANRGFWIAKIERNMQRDRANNAKLELLGYTVLRFWEREIKKDINYCINKVIRYTDGKRV